MDAKYKAYDRKSVDAADRHQLLTYIAGYTAAPAQRAILVHPAPGGATRRTLGIDGPRGRRLGVIEVVGIDTRLPPSLANEPLRQHVAAFLADGPPR